uniref:Glutathione peroxidase n=1 Tax=Acanthochromis polyacanthus TaxID=80966 RepID=A0A3Q1FHZ6_9TELE
MSKCDTNSVGIHLKIRYIPDGLVPDPQATCQVQLTSMANKSIYDFSAETLDGQPVPLSNYRGKVLLIVNVATF